LTKKDSLKPSTWKLGEVRSNQHLKGNTGLLFTSRTVKELKAFFTDYNVTNFLQAGQLATSDVVIPAGVGSFVRHSNTIEPYLRTLGLPTKLHEAKIHVLKDVVVCRAGDALTVEKAKILVSAMQRLLDAKQGEFRINLVASWSKGKVRSL
jgi:ribosomal protein L10